MQLRYNLHPCREVCSVNSWRKLIVIQALVRTLHWGARCSGDDSSVVTASTDLILGRWARTPKTLCRGFERNRDRDLK